MTSRLTIQYSFLIISCFIMNLAHGNDLIHFGNQCLAQEAQLNKAKLRLDQLAQTKNLNRIKANQAQENLDYYQNKKARLETAITECAETTPNSAYCHQTRRQYNELNRLIEEQENTADFALNRDESNLTYEINQANFHTKQANFLALCRDSDTHYAFIQNAEAYSAVCLTGENKETITCSLF
ncbi:hypothetical protein ACMUMQ_01185 [Marinomonas sp. 2405UD66-6]|uniref:hypothetical protein n=1 Tax=Marinomonas sp. 2405UD66-6 TaxID=3391834 RepID=UPI0039C9F099